MVAVKICGITSVEDAELCRAAGVDAIGLNFAPRSPRRVGVDTAREIVAAMARRVLTVGVFVDSNLEEITAIQAATGIACVQLHGEEPPELLARLLPHAFKAIRIRDAASLDDARRYAGDHVLLDAYVPGEPGGTGKTFQWSLATAFARERQVTLAGGLVPGNVAQAVACVRPFCVDVASGVETAPGHKHPTLVQAFVAAAKRA